MGAWALYFGKGTSSTRCLVKASDEGDDCDQGPKCTVAWNRCMTEESLQ